VVVVQDKKVTTPRLQQVLLIQAVAAVAADITEPQGVHYLALVVLA
jgi:hypothetical protein